MHFREQKGPSARHRQKNTQKKGELAFSSKVAGEGIEPPAFGL